MTLVRSSGLALLALLVAGGATAAGDERFITVASTTSTEGSGLFEHLLPRFHAATDIEVRVVAVGTGQAIRLAERGDADVLFVHHRPSEERFVAEGHAEVRYDVMYNDFVIVGPGADPAGIGGTSDAASALARIASARAPFASRGDDSGTHKKERALWAGSGIDPSPASGAWYRETGSGMGATLNVASAMDAYALTDRSTWLRFANRGTLRLLVEGDARLWNPYGLLPVSAARHPHVKARDARVFVDWLVSAEGQAAIAGYRIGGVQAFFPNSSATGPFRAETR